MYIQLLYIIPIIALGLLIPLVIITQQRNKQQKKEQLDLEVQDFNQGFTAAPIFQRTMPESRINEIEKTIGLVSQTLSSQQKIIERFQGTNSQYTEDVDRMKSRLRELQKEYDILLSENYSLRAKVRKLNEQIDERAAGRQDDPAPSRDPSEDERREVQRKNLLGDTEVIYGPVFDDTREIDITGLLK
jgi:chromosome segregation ATPase